ncbi:MAG: hypothetical protein QM775_10885 [Pirellulales bacterium]
MPEKTISAKMTLLNVDDFTMALSFSTKGQAPVSTTYAGPQADDMSSV